MNKQLTHAATQASRQRQAYYTQNRDIPKRASVLRIRDGIAFSQCPHCDQYHTYQLLTRRMIVTCNHCQGHFVSEVKA